jgi:perosamine synthetase
LDPNSYNLDVADVERRITPKTKAIMAVHLGGNPADLDGLKSVAKKHNLTLIEDCAQSWGAKYQGKPIGTVGDVACFSLQNSKHITCGDGGIVATADERFGPLLQKFGDKGFNRFNASYVFDVLAPNYRMSELQSAFAAAQMTRVEPIAEKRSVLGTLLTKEISGVASIMPHKVDDGNRCTFWFYMMRVLPKKLRCDRETFVKALRAEGVEASAGYIPMVLYKMELFQKHQFFAGRWPLRETGMTTMDYSKVSCPEAETILQTSVRVPIHEAMDEDYIRSVAAGIRKVAKHFAA